MTEALLARHERVGVVPVFHLLLFAALGETDVVVRRAHQTRAFALEPLLDGVYFLRHGLLLGEHVVEAEHQQCVAVGQDALVNRQLEAGLINALEDGDGVAGRFLRQFLKVERRAVKQLQGAGNTLQELRGFVFRALEPRPRDTAANMNRRRMIRRGATYGPHLPDDASEDGEERGIAAFVLCASLIRQYEFAQNVWVNDKNFHELGNERDPIIGNQDGTLEYKIPKRPIRKKITCLPAFTTVRGGAYFFLPGLKDLRWLAALGGGG